MFAAPEGGQGSSEQNSYFPFASAWSLPVPAAELIPTRPTMLPKGHPPTSWLGQKWAQAVSEPTPLLTTDHLGTEETLLRSRLPLFLG